MKKKIHIIGTGPIGLILGWQLQKNNCEVSIYEKNDIVGGMCRTWKWKDFLLDTGPHIFHTPDENLANYWEKEFGDLFIKGDFWCKNVAGKNFDEYWDYPLSWETISKFPKELKTKVLDDLKNIDEEKKHSAKNYQEYIEGQVGKTIAKMFFETYPKKVWGIPTNEMTPDWAPKRIEFREKIKPFYDKQWNAVGKYGTGSIYENIKEKFLELGGNLFLNHQLTEIKHTEKKIISISFGNNKNIDFNKEDLLISSLPITLTAKFLSFKCDLKFRGIRSIYLAYNKEKIIKDNIHWLYYGDKNISFNRVTEPKKLTPYVSPKHQSYITLEITYNQKDEIDLMDESSLIKKMVEEVELVGLANKKDFLYGSSNKEPFVYPLMYKGYQQELSEIKSELSKYQQLYSVGTGGDFNYADSQVLFHKAFDISSAICKKDQMYTDEVRKSPAVEFNKEIIINNKTIGDQFKTFIIAEIGLNHNGSKKIAKELIDEAVLSDCDAVKIQSFIKGSRISNKIKSANYAEKVIGLEESLDETFDRLVLSFEDQKEIFDYARSKNILIFSTPFDFESVDFLEKMNVQLYKIASMDLVNLPLIKYIAKKQKPIILSTGMSSLGQIEEAINTIKEEGNPNLAILHCNSSYPSSIKDMNLNLIPNLKKIFNIPVGLSDHTFGLFTSHTAMVLGANIVERHFTLNRTFEGPDHILSSEPKEFKELVSISKKIKDVLGSGVKKIMPSEYETINSQRKCLFAACNIKKGEKITREKIVIKGPGGGLLPKYIDVVVNRIAQVDIERDHQINWNQI